MRALKLIIIRKQRLKGIFPTPIKPQQPIQSQGQGQMPIIPDNSTLSQMLNPQANLYAQNGTNVKATNPNAPEILKPITKVMPFSNRPQRYTKCVVKESDLMLKTSNNDEAKTAVGATEKMPDVQIPTRVVMNNKTLSIFKGVEYEDLIISFNMQSCEFNRSQFSNQGCFTLKEGIKKAILCPFSQELDNKTLEEWDYDFGLFKNQCNTSRDVLVLDQNSLQKKFEEKIVNQFLTF
jgi:hypothetical protein